MNVKEKDGEKYSTKEFEGYKFRYKFVAYEKKTKEQVFNNDIYTTNADRDEVEVLLINSSSKLYDIDRYESGIINTSTKEQDDKVSELLIDFLKEDKEIPITYGLIKNTIGWSEFCDVTGHNHYAIKEFGDYPMNEVFNIKETEAKKLGLI